MQREGVAREVRFKVRRSSLYTSSVLHLGPVDECTHREELISRVEGEVSIVEEGMEELVGNRQSLVVRIRSHRHRFFIYISFLHQFIIYTWDGRILTGDRNVLGSRSSLRCTPHKLVGRVQPLEDEVVAVPPQRIVDGSRIVGRRAFEPVGDGTVGRVPGLSAGEGEVDDTYMSSSVKLKGKGMEDGPRK